MGRTAKPRQAPTIGWREWIALPELSVASIKAKIDTGARSSALHAFDVKVRSEAGRSIVYFKIHPIQRNSRETVEAQAELLEYRDVRSSGGHVTRRPVIVTAVELLGKCWPIELTLTSRDDMGFRMLLGREAVRRRFLVDAGRSYYGGQPPTQQRKRSGA